jgi:hypothetical protein
MRRRRTHNQGGAAAVERARGRRASTVGRPAAHGVCIAERVYLHARKVADIQSAEETDRASQLARVIYCLFVVPTKSRSSR